MHLQWLVDICRIWRNIFQTSTTVRSNIIRQRPQVAGWLRLLTPNHSYVVMWWVVLVPGWSQCNVFLNNFSSSFGCCFMHTFVACVNLSSAFVFSTNLNGLANYHSHTLIWLTWPHGNTHTITYSLQALVNIHSIEALKEPNK